MNVNWQKIKYMANVKITMVERRFEFGKYNGYTVKDVMEKDPQYLDYLMSSRISWLFTDSEKQDMRNLKNRQSNKDIVTSNVKSRTPFEEEMYQIFKKLG